mmetsp:Transcript_19461/g.35279  ORF Transcript_19461/g.35279 Transcript_19461/m.35279 type:complete len:282 (-) Transcript_19461:75-920(-)
MSLLTFHVTCETNFGETVLIVGNHPSLGNWDPHFSELFLTTDPEFYPTWSGQAKLSAGLHLEYKVVVLNGKSISWESGDNRTLLVVSNSMVVSASFGVPGGMITSEPDTCTSGCGEHDSEEPSPIARDPLSNELEKSVSDASSNFMSDLMCQSDEISLEQFSEVASDTPTVCTNAPKVKRPSVQAQATVRQCRAERQDLMAMEHALKVRHDLISDEIQRRLDRKPRTLTKPVPSSLSSPSSSSSSSSCMCLASLMALLFRKPEGTAQVPPAAASDCVMRRR